MENKILLAPVHQLFSETWKFFQENFNKLFLITLVMMSPSIIMQLIQIILASFLDNTTDVNQALANLYPLDIVVPLVMLVLFLFSIVAGVWGTIALITYIQEKDPKLSIHEAFNKNAGLFWSYLWASIIVGVLVLLGTLALLIPGIYLAIAYTLFNYILVSEKLPARQAVKKSRLLVKDYWWDVLGRFLVLLIIFIAAAILLSVTVALSKIIYSFVIIILSLLATPFMTVYFFNVYQNLKKIKKI